MTEPTATYTKLRSGDWGIRVQGTVEAGAMIVVTKKSGEAKSETVAKVVWSGNGITLCAIGARSSSGGARYGSYATIGARQQVRMDRTGWSGCSCGSIEGRPRESDCRQCQLDE